MTFTGDNIDDILDSIGKINIENITYFSSKDLSKILDNPRPYNLIKPVRRSSVISHTNNGHKELFLDSFGLVSVFIKSRKDFISSLSDDVMKYLSRRFMYVKGGESEIYDEAPPEVIDRYRSRNNIEFYDKKTLPIPRKYIKTYGGWIPIYELETEYPLFSITNLSRVFSIDAKKSIKKIKEIRRKKLIKVDYLTGDKFSWFTDPVGMVELIIRSNSNLDIDESRNLFNLIIRILGEFITINQ